jgi:hypothetical protein
MGSGRAERRIEIAGTPGECFDAIVDYDSFPDWQRAVKAVRVLSRDRAGRGRRVAFVIDAKLRSVRYTLDYRYAEPREVRWSYVEGDPKDVEGELLLDDDGRGGTLATYSLRIDFGVWLPGPVVRVLNEQVMQGALEDLKRRVEG